MGVFEKLAPYIQDFIYREKWSELREIQVAACEVIFESEDNLLLSTGTASGKTEAAFLPALTAIHNNPSSSIGILYVSPLKALINDQFVRLDYLLEEGNIPVYKWHGDVPQTHKTKALNKPQGIIQITPESLESLLIRHKADCIKLFSDLRFIIIDEVHNFMASPRGIQLLSILNRLQKTINKIPRRIGLSATLGNNKSAEVWINSDTDRKCQTPNVPVPKRSLSLIMNGFPINEYKGKTDDNNIVDFYNYLYSLSKNKKTLIFATRRNEVEDITLNLKDISYSRKEKDVFRIHHGSLSASVREFTEEDMKKSELPLVTTATVTLELGIDIGALDRVIQVGSPFSVSSLAQRIGRCGRRGQTAELGFVFIEEIGDKKPELDINWGMIKTIAMIQLFIEERWVEPIDVCLHPYSIIFHQTLAFLASNGEIQANQLAQQMLSMDIFKNITKEDFKLLLSYMLESEMISKTELGTIILGIEGEKLVNHYEFFAVFSSLKEYEVKHENHSLGTVQQKFNVGDKFCLAGKSWEVSSVDEKSTVIFVQPIRGKTKNKWIFGDLIPLHTKVIRKIKEILSIDKQYKFLGEYCSKRLQESRFVAVNSKIIQELVLEKENNRFHIFPWLGTRQLSTLIGYLETIDGILIKPSNVPWVYIELEYHGSKQQLELLIYKGIKDIGSVYQLSIPKDACIPNKYNEFLPKQLLEKQYILDYLDLEGLKKDLQLL